MSARLLYVAKQVARPRAQAPAHGASAHVAVTIAALERSFQVVTLEDPVAPTSGSRRRRPRFVPSALRGARQDLLRIVEDRAFADRLIETSRETPISAIYERDEYMSIAGARAARSLDVPLILEVNGLLARDQRVYYRSPLEPLGGFLERWKLRRADAVITVSPGLADLLVELGAPSERVHVVPNAVPDEVVRPGPRTVDPQAFTVGFVGHLMPWHARAVEMLVDAAPAVLDRVREARFEVIGDGPDLPRVRQRAREEGVEEAFTFHGAVPYSEVPEFVRAFDVGVIPAVFDYAFPVKLVQMGAAGIPLVAPASSSLDRQIEPGIDYLPFDPGDTGALADALVLVLQDTDARTRLGRALYESVRDRFTVSAIAPHLERVVRSAVDATSVEVG